MTNAEVSPLVPLLPSPHESLRETLDLPLEFLPLDTLWNMDGPAARAAIERRMHAFHEAGHIWATLRADRGPAAVLHLVDAHAGPRLDHETAVRVAAMGPVAQGLLVEADGIRLERCIPPHVPHMLIEGYDEFDGWQIREHFECVCDECCCRRGGDALAAEVLDDEDWIENELTAVIRDWIAIEAAAFTLLAGRTLDNVAIRGLMATQAR